MVTTPASTVAGTPFNLTVKALDASGAIVPGYTGTVHFTSSDGSATLPANYTFIAGDNGAHTFTGVVLATPGSQTITVADIAMPFTTPGSATVRVLCVGTCPAPSGTAASRNTVQSSAGIAGGRTGVSQSSSGVPGPRLPRVSQPAQSGDTASAAGPSAGTAAPNVAAAAPAAAPTSTSPQSAPPATGVDAAATSTTPVQASAHRALSLTTRSDPVSRSPDPIPWNVLLLIPLVVSTLALLALRRRRIKEKSNARI